MKPKNTHLAALTCASLLGSTALSQANVLWQLDFSSYADGDLNTQPVGQPGFPANWFDGSAIVTSGVVTSGNSKAELDKTFSAAVGATGTIWLSFDWGHNNTGDHASTYGGLSFFESNYPTVTEKGLIGNTWDNPNWNTTSVSNIGMKTAVAKITLSDVGSDTVDLWVGATGSPVDVSGSPMATLSMELSNVNCVRINGGNAQTFDNLVIGTTVADVDAINGPPATDYEIWGTPYGLAAGSEGGDLDNDGVTNFEEYAFGLIPNSGASVNPIAAPLDKTAGTFSYTRRTGSGLGYSVWYSTTLEANSWLEDTSAAEGTPVPSGDNETVEVTLSNLPGDPLPAKLFIQVRAD